MSSVVLQVGQCGNQIGQEFWKQVDEHFRVEGFHEDYIHAHLNNGNKYYRSVNVDTEQKVIRKLTKESEGVGIFRKTNLITGRCGRGSNWALGYHGSKMTNQEDIFERTAEVMRKEVERCDSYNGTVLIHSISGGTGSGVGSRLTELLRDEYPEKFLLSCIVTPFFGGESPLQHYNSILTLSKLCEHSDCILAFDNDEILRRLQLNKVTAKNAVSLSLMNMYVASCISGVLLPMNSSTHKDFSTGQELIRLMCPSPSMKFACTDYTTRKKPSWDDAVQAIGRTLGSREVDMYQYATVATLAVVRGTTVQPFTRQSMISFEKKIRSLYCMNNQNKVDFWTANSNTSSQNDNSTSLTIATNSSIIVPYLEHNLQTAQKKYDCGAYLHWYTKYGAKEYDFEQAFDKIQTVIDSYNCTI